MGIERRPHLRVYPGCGYPSYVCRVCEYAKVGFRPVAWDLYCHLLYRVSNNFCCHLPRNISPPDIDSWNSHCFRWDCPVQVLKFRQRLKTVRKRIHLCRLQVNQKRRYSTHLNRISCPVFIVQVYRLDSDYLSMS